jgi:hypothetical protein
MSAFWQVRAFGEGESGAEKKPRALLIERFSKDEACSSKGTIWLINHPRAGGDGLTIVEQSIVDC